jgi:hypothetical protein
LREKASNLGFVPQPSCLFLAVGDGAGPWLSFHMLCGLCPKLGRNNISVDGRKYEDVKLRYILMHETTHGKRLDIFVKWLLIFPGAIHTAKSKGCCLFLLENTPILCNTSQYLQYHIQGYRKAY